MTGQVLEEIMDAKYLGITLSNDLEWSKHIATMTNKANSKLLFLCSNLKDWPEKLIFIHRSITFSKQPPSPESLSNPHLEELSIKAELRHTKLIISNVYIPPSSSCSNGYHSSMEHLLTTPDTLILGDFLVL